VLREMSTVWRTVATGAHILQSRIELLNAIV
jgi:hypothetical protein